MAEIKITANTQQAQKSIDDLGKAMQGLENAGISAKTALLSITAAAAGVSYALSRTLTATSDMIDFSRSIGMGAESLRLLQNSAKLSGLGVEELNMGLKKMQVNLGDALVKGAGPASDALKRLGLNAQQLGSMRPEQQLTAISKAFGEIESPAIRASLATDLFGKSGAKMLQAADDAARLNEEYQQMGIALSNLDYANIAKADDALQELKDIAAGALQKALAELAPYIITLVEQIKEAIKNAGGFDEVIKTLGKTFRVAAEVAAAFLAYMAVGKIIAIATAFYEIVKAVKAMAIAIAAGEAIATGGLSAIATATLGVAAATGAAILVNKQFDKLLADTAVTQQKLAADTNTTSTANQGLAGSYNAVNEAAKKALETLDATIIKMQAEVQYQKDIVALGETEAKVRKTIADENEKLKKVGLELTTNQQNLLRSVIEEEAAVKRLTTLRKEQADSINSLLRGTTQLSQEINKMGDLNLQFKGGMSKDEIAKMREAEALGADPTGDKAIANQQVKIKKIVDAEIGKYDKLYAEDQRYQQAIQELDEISTQAKLGNIKLNEDQVIAFENARMNLEKDHQIKLIELQNQEFANFTRINDLKIQADAERHAASLRNQKDFMGNQMFSEATIKTIAKDRADFEKKTELEKTQFALQNMQTVFSSLGAQNKKAFEANKALAIASALVNTYMGATKALATYPWPFGLIAAAAAVAAGFAQVSAIRSQQYSGRALGGPVMGGQSYMVGENGPELFTPSTTGSITRNGDLQSGGRVEVNFTIVANDTQGFDQLLTSRKGVIQQIISDAMLERGQRSMV